MQKKLLLIYKDKIKRKKYLKIEIKKIILKSIFQNFNSNELIRSLVLKKLTFLHKKSHISKQNNMCLITGRMGGNFKVNDLSRHVIKNIGKANMLQNINIKSW